MSALRYPVPESRASRCEHLVAPLGFADIDRDTSYDVSIERITVQMT